MSRTTYRNGAMFFLGLAVLLLALLVSPADAQQALCDYTAEADAADIDGFELLMGDPADSCEGYSVAFTDFLAAIQATGINASAIDADGDGNEEVYLSTVGGQPAICLNAIDGASGCAGYVDDTGGGSRLWVDAILAGESVFLGPTKATATSSWWMRAVSSTRFAVNNSTGGDALDIICTGLGCVTKIDSYGTLPTCDATYNNGLVVDADSDLCFCLSGSGWEDLNTAGGSTCE